MDTRERGRGTRGKKLDHATPGSLLTGEERRAFGARRKEAEWKDQKGRGIGEKNRVIERRLCNYTEASDIRLVEETLKKRGRREIGQGIHKRKKTFDRKKKGNSPRIGGLAGPACGEKEAWDRSDKKQRKGDQKEKPSRGTKATNERGTKMVISKREKRKKKGRRCFMSKRDGGRTFLLNECHFKALP